jgi:hypothetical protein
MQQPQVETGNISKALHAGGEAPLQVDQLLGQLAQPQIPYAPIVSSVPNVNDPQSQDGSLVVLSDGLYQFDGRTSPGAWAKVADLSTGTERVYAQSRATVTVVGAAATDQALHTVSVAADDLNVAGRIIRLYGEGVYNTQAGQTPTFTFKLKWGTAGAGVVLATFGPTAATTASSANIPWSIEATLVCYTIGASGTLEGTGRLTFVPGNAAAAAASVFTSIAQPTVNLTATTNITFTVQYSTQTGGSPFNGVDQRLSIAEVLNF